MTAQNIIITNVTREYACIDRTDNHYENVVIAHTNVVDGYGKEVVGIGYENREGDIIKQTNEAIEDAYFMADLHLNSWKDGNIL